MVNNVYSWNPVYDFVINLKHEYQDKFGKINNYQYDVPCVNYWADNIDNKYYQNVLKYLDINQYGNLVLIRYKGYDELFHMEDFSMDSFWDDNDGFYRECRSLVIDVYVETIVLCPFKKFRNVNESENESLENLIKRINANKGVYEVTEKKMVACSAQPCITAKLLCVVVRHLMLKSLGVWKMVIVC